MPAQCPEMKQARSTERKPAQSPEMKQATSPEMIPALNIEKTVQSNKLDKLAQKVNYKVNMKSFKAEKE